MSALLAAAGIALPSIDYTAILPELILLGGMVLLLGVSGLVPRPIGTETYATATVGLGTASLIASLILWHDVQNGGAFFTVARSIDVDGFACFGLVLASVVTIVAGLLAPGYLRQERTGGPEYYVLALISASGAMLMASANDLILIFLGLEILSIPLYVMAGMNYRSEGSSEAALKYFVLGAFSSAVFVYGIALTYGATGSTNLGQIAAFLSRNVVVNDGVLLGGLGLLIVGFGFKVAAVPFHMWTPDVYQGSPTPAVGFMASIAKVGGFAALLRVVIATMPTLASTWKPIIWVAAAASLLLGATAALVQRDVKRMLAYSSINHAGFILIGVQAGTVAGSEGALYYLFAYSLLVLGSFAVVAIVGGEGDANHDLAAYRGLVRRSPALATAFAVLLIAQAGAPFTTGFFSKFYVVEASVASHSYALAVIAMLSAGVAAFFYLRVVLIMFGTGEQPATVRERPYDLSSGRTPQPAGMGPGAMSVLEQPEDAAPSISPWAALGLFCCVGATVLFGFWPQPLVSFAHQATLLFH